MSVSTSGVRRVRRALSYAIGAALIATSALSPVDGATATSAAATTAKPGLGRPAVSRPKDTRLSDVKPSGGRATAAAAEKEWQASRKGATAALAEQRSTATTLSAATAKVAGDYSATPLSPSASWSAGGSSGSFDWSYDFESPPAAAGPAPSLGLSYDSGSVDGRLPSANNQPSVVGEGFQLSNSYVERSYGVCDDDGHAQKFDLCWEGDQVSIVLNGQSNRLIKVNDDSYRLEHDDGSRVEHKTGGANADNNGEHWVVTTTDGTRYYFGLDRLPGAAAGADRTNSTWTVPVFGDDAGEPCHSADGFGDSACPQAWRWNLDYVVDTNNNAATYWYTTETNRYAKNGNENAGVQYVRGGYLKEVDYGLRADGLFDIDAQGNATTTHPAPQQIALTYKERCLQSGDGCDTLNDDTKTHWPDVPFKSICAQGDTCTDDWAPTFFTRKRLDTVTTQVRAGNDYQPVDSWKLGFDFFDAEELNNTDDQTLVLSSITRTAGNTTSSITLAPTRLSYRKLDNRVDGGNDDIIPLGKPRLDRIISETGAITTVTYSSPDCWQVSPQHETARLPGAADNNKMRCFPAFWSPYGAEPQKDWFHKYVVTSIAQTDTSGGAVDLVTSYLYGNEDGSSNDGAWHRSEQPMTPKRERTWSDWRGYDRVVTLTGDSFSELTRLKTVDYYLRGMDGDKDSDGNTKPAVTVTGVNAPAIPDADQYKGFHRETITYLGQDRDGTTGAEVRGTVFTPWSRQTATQTFPSQTVGGTTYPAVTTRAWMVRTRATDALTHVTSSSPAADLHVVTSTDDFDAYGLATAVYRYTKDVTGTVADKQCTKTWYARNTTKHIVDRVARTQVVSRDCDTSLTAAPSGIVSDQATIYDTTTVPSASGWDGQTPVYGNAQIALRASAWTSAGTPTAWQTISKTAYDDLGRIRSLWDAQNHQTSTTYVPAGAGVPVSVAVTNALNQQTSLTTLEPLRGLVVKIEDINNKLTEISYDPLGRTTQVWTPATPKALDAPPAIKYQYHLGVLPQGSNIADESWVATSTLSGNTSDYRTSYQFYDAMLRPLQTQTASPSGGRIITESTYDSRGLVTEGYADIYDSTSGPTNQRVGVLYGRSPRQTETTYDGAGRPTVARLLVGGIERFRTLTSYTGDAVAVTPPAGGTPTAEMTDALGRVVEKRQYKGPSPTGSFVSTKTHYGADGRMDSVTGPDGAVWGYGYDVYGRLSTLSDPDRGTTTTTYTTLDQVDTTTDARGQKLLYDYDALGRKTVSYATDRTVANKRTTWTYDPVGTLGQLNSQTRWVAGKAFTSTITAWDPMYRPKSTTLTLPSDDPLVTNGAVPTAGLTFKTAYNRDGSVQSTTEPAVGGLPSEVISTSYDPTGQPLTMSGSSGYVLGTVYDPIGLPLQLNLGQSSTSTKKAYLTNSFEAGTGRLLTSEITDDVHPWMVQSLQYGYDDAGHVTSIFDPTTRGGTSAADYQCFSRDGLGQVVDAWTPKTASCATGGRVSTNLGGPAPYWYHWAYKGDTGMRESEQSHAVVGTSDTVTTTSYTYGSTCGVTGTRPHVLVGTSVKIGSGSATAASYACDATGNTTSRPGAAAQALTWDPENKLTKVARGTDTNYTNYVYDPDGNLLIRRPTTITADTSTVLYLGATEVKMTKNANGQIVITGQRYYDFNGSRVATRTAKQGTSGTTLTFLAGDHHGTSTVALAATDLTITKRYQTPFGKDRSGTWIDDKGFLGKPVDVGTGLTHVGAREYDAGIGRFISPDPVLDPSAPLSLNGYAYSDNDPLTLSDPTGLEPKPKGIDRCASAFDDCTEQEQQAKDEGLPQGCLDSLCAEPDWRTTPDSHNSYSALPNPKKLATSFVSMVGNSLYSLAYGGGATPQGRAYAQKSNESNAVFAEEAVQAALLASLFIPEARLPIGVLKATTVRGSERVAAETTLAALSRPSSRVLGVNLEAAGLSRPAGSAAHHIVAGSSKKAAEGRLVLRRFDIDINDPNNGVFLPSNMKSPNPTGAAVHSRIHTNAYYSQVNEMLSQATSRSEAMDVLRYVRSQLLSGGFP